jgi:hypothetical protein
MKFDAMLLRRWMWLLVLFSPCFAVLSGCGGKQMYHVRGKVTYKDGSIPKGTLAIVTFSPAADTTAGVRKGASGAIDPDDGSFEMVTRTPGDGVNPGSYGVTFRVTKDTASGSTPLVNPKFSAPASPQFTVKVDRDITGLNYQIEKGDGAAAVTVGPEAPAGPGAPPGP